VNIIFLDIDGVLNYQNVPKSEKVVRPYGEVSIKCVALLNKLTSESKAKIVVSSTWRKDGTQYGTIGERLLDMGVTGEVIDSTPDIHAPSSFRGNEIYEWIRDNDDLLGCKHCDYKDYVILDDDSDMLLWQANNFIEVDRWTGITPHTVFKAKKILGI